MGSMMVGDELGQRVLSALTESVDGLHRCSQLDLDSDSLRQLLTHAFGQRNRLDAALTGLIGKLDQRCREENREEPEDPAPSCATWLRGEVRLTHSAAYGQVALARRLPELPETASAFAEGRLSSQHVSAIVRTVNGVARGGGPAAAAEAMMLEQAVERDPQDLELWGRDLRHRLNPRELADAEEQDHERRYLRLRQSRWSGGYDLDGHLDVEGGTILRTALQGLLGPRPKRDERTPGQRRADGLVDIARRCLDSGSLPLRGGQRPHLTVTASLDTLLGTPGAAAAELDWGFPISGEMLRRIACDAELTPILLGREGDPLRVGRSRRTASPRQRRALAERDRHCPWPGCDRPPDWCQGHHRTPWAAGGETAVDEMHLLCGYHHRKVHLGYRLVRQAHGAVTVEPPERAGPVFGPAIHAPPPPPVA